MEIKTLNDLSMNIGHFDNAEKSDIYYKNIKSDQFQGVINKTTGKMVQVVSNNYQIIQHNDVVQSVVEALGSKNMDVVGRLDTQNNRLRMDLIFSNQGVPIKDDASGVKIGIRVLNSYNKQTSFRLEMYGFRLVCQNGMSLGRAMNSVKEVCMHTGDKKPLATIKKLTEDFIVNVVNSSSELQRYINESMEDSTGWMEVTNLLKNLIKQKKHLRFICEKLGIEVIEIKDKFTSEVEYRFCRATNEPFNLTRWDLYNILTNYATHSDLGFSVKENLQNVAQKVLVTNFNKLNA